MHEYFVYFVFNLSYFESAKLQKISLFSHVITSDIYKICKFSMTISAFSAMPKPLK